MARADGTSGGAFPDLIPPTQQPTPMADLSLSTLLANARIDRAAIVAAVVAVSDAVAHESAERIGHMVADKLGYPPDAPKAAPWVEAYEAWFEGAQGPRAEIPRMAWQAAWEACERHHGIRQVTHDRAGDCGGADKGAAGGGSVARYVEGCG